jgi:sigma-B regulation protein RsbU (phosphoserine phosphatase)
MSSEQNLKNKLKELEEEISLKNKEIAKYRGELSKANTVVEKMISDMAQELKMALKIQKILSPTELPNIQGFEFSSKFIPGAKMGGDYFDIFEHNDRLKFGIIVASSSGYAMSALFLSVLIKLSSAIEARKGLGPDEVVAKLAEELVPGINNDDTASIFYAVIDRRTFELKYASCGSILGLLQPHGQDSVIRLEASTGPLQKSFKSKALAQNLSLGPKDRLILCTEGVVAAQNGQGQNFGLDRLSKAISRAPRTGVHELRNEILFELESFCGKSHPHRDQTVIVTEVNDRVIKLAKNTPL